jgi:hypothetical protein
LITSPLAVPGEDDDAEEEPSEIDIYGNEVSAAVATYQVDHSGSIYEMHSPHTEVPRLAPPKS